MKGNILVAALITMLRLSAVAYEMPLFGATQWPIGRCDIDTNNPQSFQIGVEVGIQRWDGDKLQPDVQELWFFQCSRLLNSDRPGEFLKNCSLVRQTLNSRVHGAWQAPAQFYSLDSKNLELVVEDWKSGHLKVRTFDNDVIETDVRFKCDSKSGEIRLTEFVGHTVAKAGNPPAYRAPDYRVPKETFAINWGFRITGMMPPKNAR